MDALLTTEVYMLQLSAIYKASNLIEINLDLAEKEDTFQIEVETMCDMFAEPGLMDVYDEFALVVEEPTPETVNAFFRKLSFNYHCTKVVEGLTGPVLTLEKL